MPLLITQVGGGIGRRRGASEEGGESGEEEPDESLDWTGKCMNEHGLQTL